MRRQRSITCASAFALLFFLVPHAAGAEGACANREPTIVGTADAETIYGTDGPDVIYADAGADDIYGLSGDDVICGGPGFDTIFGDGGSDSLFGGPDGDQMNGDGRLND